MKTTRRGLFAGVAGLFAAPAVGETGPAVGDGVRLSLQIPSQTTEKISAECLMVRVNGVAMYIPVATVECDGGLEHGRG